jgi:hypothetical protein
MTKYQLGRIALSIALMTMWATADCDEEQTMTDRPVEVEAFEMCNVFRQQLIEQSKITNNS